MPWELYTSGATTCTYTYEIFKEKKHDEILRRNLLFKDMLFHVLPGLVWTPKATGFANCFNTKLPMKDAGSTGLRRTMPSSPGDALPITANLYRIKLMSGMSRGSKYAWLSLLKKIANIQKKTREPRMAAISI